MRTDKGIEPDRADTYLMTGIIYSRVKRLDDTQPAFDKAIEQAPQQPEAYNKQASLYLGANRKLPKARALAETAVQLQPVAINYVTLCQARDRTGDFAGALSAIERAMALDPDNAKFRRIYEWMKNRK
jgi:Flp pilus assembly protein TadD